MGRPHVAAGPHRGGRAFSLLEVAIILTVVAIAAAVVVPVQINSIRAHKAEQLTRQFQTIIDAAKRVWFYNSRTFSRMPTSPPPPGLPYPINDPLCDQINECNDWEAGYTLDNRDSTVGTINWPVASAWPVGIVAGPKYPLSTFSTLDALGNPTLDYVPRPEDFASWPGQRWGTSGRYKCRSSMDVTRAKREIVAIGNLANNPADPLPAFIDQAIFDNPWGQPIMLSLDSNGNGNPALMNHQTEFNCWFTITTDVPVEIALKFSRLIPNGMCNFPPVTTNCSDLAPPGPPNFVRCCGSIARPGWEPQIRRWWWPFPGPTLTDASAPNTTGNLADYALESPFCDPWQTTVGFPAGTVPSPCDL